ncbi:MAG: tRNA (cytidine(34)-2'-O)-methyltransferase [Gammaproteobacteria bacterium]|nr:tRNA (cytidine(34)-2'-O)-methyltransferase [Gammaproteobacteria bacterium]
MLDLILFEPEIPPNTGNIIRLCANTGISLHLVGRLGFALSDAKLRRAGLDYHEWASVRQHAGLPECLAALGHPRVFAVSTRGTTPYMQAQFRVGDALLFGPEQRGLPGEVLAALPAARILRIPMRSGSRSLNLSNAAAVVGYEAWRQLGFPGGD